MPHSKLKQINIYPIKSGPGIELLSSQVGPLGLDFDRRFVLTDLNGQFITARTHNKLCLISSVLTDKGLQLNAPGMPELNIEYHKLAQYYKSVQIWSDKVDAQYCSIHYDLWFSGFLGQSCQLFYFGELSVRHVYNSDEQITFADGYPLLSISQASFDDLNSRNQMPIVMSRFRPNLVVDQTEAFAVDGWKRIKIGEVVFEVAKPCARCVFITIDPITAKKHPTLEPLATLQKYRQDVDGEVM
ncbi:MAG: MOSC domain-containing protein, partial [Paraglaciecola sp.]|nr:MOSC domain-containing protein [Paraglaciecola sp.]